MLPEKKTGTKQENLSLRSPQTFCRGCGAKIVWAELPSGKLIPLDARPEKRFILQDYWALVDTYLTHFATCPKADEFRNKKD